MSTSLTVQQRNAVQTLRAVVGPLSDSEAVGILQNHNWDIDDAVSTLLAAAPESVAHLPNQPNASPSFSSSSSASSLPPPALPQSSSASSSSSSSSSSSGGILRGLGSLPGSWIVKNAFSFVSRHVWGAIGSDDSKSAHTRLLEEFESQYNVHPNFVHGTYLDAIRVARAANKMLFVYLRSTHHDDAPRFERETLCTEQVRDFLAINFISWMGDVRHPDAFQLSDSLKVESYPFSAVLLPHGGQVVVVHRFAGFVSPDELVARLMSFLDAHSNIVQQQTVRNSVQDEARLLREQQDIEFQEALERDRQRRRKEEEKLRQEEKERQEQLLAMQREEEKKQAVQRAREQKRARLPVEPPAGSDAVAVAVRLPDGTKIQRRFLSSHTMQSIFDWIETHELQVDGHPIERYQLVSTHPKRTFIDPSVDLKAAQLGRQCLLIVQELADESSD